MPIPRPPFPDYYADLRVAPDASQDEVRSAWRQAAKRWHPDTNRSDQAPAMMRRVNEAWDVLGDRDNRREYDDLYYVWRSGSEQLAAGLRERLNEQRQRQRTREEAEAWNRWAQQDRATWEREATQEAQTGATGQRDEGRAAEPTRPDAGNGEVEHGSAPGAQSERSSEGSLWVFSALVVVVMVVTVLIAFASSN